MRNIIKILFYWGLYVFDTWFLIKKYFFNNKIKEYDHILLLNLGGLGDMIIFLGQLLKFKKNEDISIVIDKNHKILFEKIKIIKNIFTIDTKKYANNLLYRKKINYLFSNKKFLEIYNCRGSRMYNYEDGIVRFISGKKIALESDLFKEKKILLSIFDKSIYSKTISYDIQENFHELERTNIIFNKIFNNSLTPDIYFLDKYLKDIIGKKKINKNYCLINTGGYDVHRKWNIKNFIKLGNKMEKQIKLTPIYCGLELEKKLIENCPLKISDTSINLCDKTTIKEYINLVYYSNLSVSNDSSCTHIAKFLNKKNLCIKSKYKEGYFTPYPSYSKNENVITISKKYIHNVNIDEALSLCLDLNNN